MRLLLAALALAGALCTAATVAWADQRVAMMAARDVINAKRRAPPFGYRGSRGRAHDWRPSHIHQNHGSAP